MHSLAEIMEKLYKLGLVYEPEDSVSIFRNMTPLMSTRNSTTG